MHTSSAGVASQHAAQHQGGHGERLLVGEPQPQVAVEAGQAFVAARRVDATGGRVDEQRDVQLHACSPDHVEVGVVERSTEVGADVRTEQSEL